MATLSGSSVFGRVSEGFGNKFGILMGAGFSPKKKVANLAKRSRLSGYETDIGGRGFGHLGGIWEILAGVKRFDLQGGETTGDFFWPPSAANFF